MAAATVSYVEELLDSFARQLRPGGVGVPEAERIARVVLTMPSETRAERIAQIAAWLAALDQAAASRVSGLIS